MMVCLATAKPIGLGLPGEVLDSKVVDILKGGLFPRIAGRDKQYSLMLDALHQIDAILAAEADLDLVPARDAAIRRLIHTTIRVPA